MADLTLRSVKGADLTPAEEEANHVHHKERIDAIVADPPSARSISEIRAVGNNLYVDYTDVTTDGPFTIPGSPASYDVGFRIGTTSPAAGEIIGIVPVPTDRTPRFAANLGGANGFVDTPPGADYVVSIKDDGTEIGTITIHDDGTSTYATTGGTAKTVVAGSILTFVAPDQGTAQDAAIANGVWLIPGELV